MHFEKPCISTGSVAPLMCLALPLPISASTRTPRLPDCTSFRFCSTADCLVFSSARRLPLDIVVFVGIGSCIDGDDVASASSFSFSIASCIVFFRSAILNAFSLSRDSMTACHAAVGVYAFAILATSLVCTIPPSSEIHWSRPMLRRPRPDSPPPALSWPAKPAPLRSQAQPTC